MNEKPLYTYNYEQDADVLYISFAFGEKATTAVELNDNILLRFNHAEKRAIGLTLMDFSVLIQLTEVGQRGVPLSGLSNLEPEWQELVIDLITSPPVNQILKVSSFTPSLTNSIPVAFVERPPITVAA